MKSVSGKFLGNSIETGNVIVGHVPYYGATYGGAIFNSSVNHYRALLTYTPSADGIIGSISGEFIANGVIMTIPTGQTPAFYIDSSYQYIAYLTEGAFGGAIANQFGTINAINNSVFENNYVISTATSGSKGNIGGAGVYNSASKYIWWRGHGFQPVTSSIGSITANFNENVAHTENGNISGGTILNVANENGTATIGNISGKFNKNSAVALKGNVSGSVIGNILEHPAGTATIDTISGTFKENTADASGMLLGLIYNSRVVSGSKSKNAVISGIENSTFDKNSGKAAYVYGGVISNFGTITNGIKNSTFTNNTFTASSEGVGAAIYSSQNLTTAADNGTTLFKGNKINDIANAVYMDDADLTVTAINGGTVTFYDSIDGSLGYKARLTGDADSHINLYNDIKNAYVTADSTNISTADGNIKEYDMYNLVADNTAKWTIDFSVEGEEADSFATDTQTGTAGKVVQIDHFNLIDKAFNEITNKNFKVQILKTQGTTEAANLQLALTARPLP